MTVDRKVRDFADAIFAEPFRILTGRTTKINFVVKAGNVSQFQHCLEARLACAAQADAHLFLNLSYVLFKRWVHKLVRGIDVSHIEISQT